MPEEHAVLVLDQDDRYGRVLGQRPACMHFIFLSPAYAQVMFLSASFLL